MKKAIEWFDRQFRPTAEDVRAKKLFDMLDNDEIHYDAVTPEQAQLLGQFHQDTKRRYRKILIAGAVVAFFVFSWTAFQAGLAFGAHDPGHFMLCVAITLLGWGGLRVIFHELQGLKARP